MAQRSGRWRRRIPGFRNHDEEERYESADIADIYQRAARQDLSTRNPVIVIPGVMGSKLVASESTRSLWGDFRKGARPDSSDDARLIALPMERGRPLHLLHSLSESDGTLGQIKSKVAGISIRLSFYSDVLSALGVGSYGGSHSVRSKHIPDYHREEGASVAFEFSYDWRRSLDESAARLQQFITQATRFIQLQLGNSDPIKFDIVAHSMGGLVLRYFLQYGGQLLPYDGSLPRLNWVGAEMIETAIIVAHQMEAPSKCSTAWSLAFLKTRCFLLLTPSFWGRCPRCTSFYPERATSQSCKARARGRRTCLTRNSGCGCNGV